MLVHRVPRVSIGALLLISLLCTGCGKSAWPQVSGIVEFDGKPIVTGSISFEPADGQGPTAGGSIQDGEYLVPQVMPGKKIVRIVASRKTGRRVQRPMSGPSALAEGATIDEIERYLPPVYNTQSVLTCEVNAHGSNRIDFHLQRP